MTSGEWPILAWSGPTGDSFALRVTGYQFPEEANPQSGVSNWLDIAIEAQSGGESWQAESSALLVDEMVVLAAWLKAILAGPVKADASFLEPNLRFADGQATTDGHRVVVHLSLEFKSPLARAAGSDTELVLVVGAAEIQASIGRIGDCMKQYPPRGDDGQQAVATSTARAARRFGADT